MGTVHHSYSHPLPDRCRDQNGPIVLLGVESSDCPLPETHENLGLCEKIKVQTAAVIVQRVCSGFQSQARASAALLCCGFGGWPSVH